MAITEARLAAIKAYLRTQEIPDSERVDDLTYQMIKELVKEFEEQNKWIVNVKKIVCKGV